MSKTLLSAAKHILTSAQQHMLQNGLDLNLDLNLLMGPGIYVIWNRAKNRVYIGQADIICARLGDHKARLKKGTHACKAMQEDWLQDEAEFIWLVLDYGPRLQPEQARTLAECEALHVFRHVAYNKARLNNVQRYLNQSVKIDGRRYETMLLASEAHDLDLKTLSLNLLDPNQPDWVFDIHSTPRGYAPPSLAVVVWHTPSQAYRYFRSFRSAANFCKQSRQTIARTARNDRLYTVRFWHQLTGQEKASVLDAPSPGQTEKKGKPIRVDTVVYTTVSEAANKTSLSRKTLARRAENSQDHHVSWA